VLVYEQDTGRLLRVYGGGVEFIATGYAGAPGFVNDPSSDHLRSRGPLPQGRYGLREVIHPRFAAPAIRLDPYLSNKMYGRSGFYIPGDNVHLNRTASTGCIVVNRSARFRVRDLIAQGETVLEVVHGSTHLAVEVDQPRVPLRGVLSDALAA
jgi:hypothetical protein